MANASELYESGRAKKTAGDLDGAMADFKAALAEDANHADAARALANSMYDHANALKDAGNVTEAVKIWREILDLNEGHVVTHMALAVHLQKLGEFDNAIRHAVRVTELDPEDAFSFTQLSVIYQRCGRIQEAEDARDKAAALAGRQRH